MLPSYSDITSRIDEVPIWYDKHGVPRYDPFNPYTHSLEVYDSVGILVRIRCQSCHEEFLVGEGHFYMDRYQHALMGAAIRKENIDNIKLSSDEEFILQWAKHYHYGDPPSHGCVGDTMNCEDIEVVEAWVDKKETEDREGIGRVITKWIGWTRIPEAEGPIDD